jgi:hypothetical protein
METPIPDSKSETDVPVQQIRRVASEVVTGPAIRAVDPKPDVSTDQQSGNDNQDDAGSELQHAEVLNTTPVRRHSMSSDHEATKRAGRLSNMNNLHTRIIDDRQIQMWYWKDVQLFDLVERFRRQQRGMMSAPLEVDSQLLTATPVQNEHNRLSRNADAISEISSISSNSNDKRREAKEFEEAMNKFGKIKK